MKTRKSTTGLVVSFFFAAAMVVILQSPAEAAELTAASNVGSLTQAVLCADNSGKKKERVHCKECNWDFH
ncbi:MAG: hypothetical protein D3917_12395 [Candidatus Electrothrix sp. AX5]|jgi:hypothetical protein|nr:hypothetical protein [Candidatus Electrothrix sp. AX5]